jgi:hypothetical protein
MVFDFGGKKGKVKKELKRGRIITFICECFFFKSQMWGVFIFSFNTCGMSSYFQVWKKKERKM